MLDFTKICPQQAINSGISNIGRHMTSFSFVQFLDSLIFKVDNICFWKLSYCANSFPCQSQTNCKKTCKKIRNDPFNSEKENYVKF